MITVNVVGYFDYDEKNKDTKQPTGRKMTCIYIAEAIDQKRGEGHSVRAYYLPKDRIESVKVGKCYVEMNLRGFIENVKAAN